jgi:hypothetical protein
MLLLLDIAGGKMPKLEEAIGEQLESEGRALAEMVAEHVLTCFRGRDPQVSLESVVQGPIAKMEEAARASVQDTTKLVVMQFQRQAEDT